MKRIILSDRTIKLLRPANEHGRIVMLSEAMEEANARGDYYGVNIRRNGEIAWEAPAPNLVTTQGGNDLLDKYLAGAVYTAAWYIGLISSVSWSAVNIADTAAQINGTNGWKEAAASNAPDYSQSTRPVVTFASAAAKSKATSAPSAFTISGAGTVKGCFLISVSTKQGTTGVLYSCGVFTGGDKTVATTDTLNVSYTGTV